MTSRWLCPPLLYSGQRACGTKAHDVLIELNVLLAAEEKRGWEAQRRGLSRTIYFDRWRTNTLRNKSKLFVFLTDSPEYTSHSGRRLPPNSPRSSSTGHTVPLSPWASAQHSRHETHTTLVHQKKTTHFHPSTSMKAFNRELLLKQSTDRKLLNNSLHNHLLILSSTTPNIPSF